MASAPSSSRLASLSSSLKANAPWLILLAVIGLLPFLSFLSSGKVLFASDQIGSPGWKFFFERLRAGELPLWNPYHLSGMPTYDALIGDGSYPIFLLLGMFLPAEKLVGLLFVLHTLLAGSFAYVLVRGHFRLDRFLSAALAAAYMLNTNYFSHIYSGHTGKFYVLTWLPLGLFFLLGSLERRTPWWKPLGLALTVTAMVLTSHLQLTYYVLMGYFLYFGMVFVSALKEKAYGHAGGVAAKFWLPILLGIGLCFPLFWGPLHYNKQFSVRGEGAKQTYEHATSWSIHPEEAASLFIPEFGGLNEQYWGRNPFKLNSEYPGIAVWFLGLFGLIALRKRFFWLWGSVGLMAIVYGLGANTPIFHLFYNVVPGIKNFRAPSMILFWLATALLLMSAQLLKELTQNREALKLNEKSIEKKLLIFGAIAGGVLLFLGIFSGVAYGIWNAFISPQEMANFAHQTAAQSGFTAGALRAGILLFVLAFALRNLIFKQRNERGFAAVLLGVVVIDLLWVDHRFIETYEFSRMFPQEAAISQLKADTSAYRVFALPGATQRGYLQYHEISSSDGWADQEYRGYRAYRGGDYNQNPTFMEGLKQNPDGSVSGSKFFDMLNVKYLLYRLPEVPGLQLAENKDVLPRARFLSQWESLPLDQHIQRMRQADFDPKISALVDAATPSPNPPSLDSAQIANAAPVEIHRENSGVNADQYRVKNDREGMLVLSDIWYPYWRLTVDGQQQSLLRVNYLFRGVYLKPGAHTVSVHYHSEPLTQGLLVSLLALFGLGILSFALAKFGDRPSTPSA